MRFSTGRRSARGFTLVEVLVAMVVLLVLVGMVFSITVTTGRTVGRVSASIDAFTAGRATFDQVTQRLSQATLNTYYDYFNSAGQTIRTAPGGSFRAGPLRQAIGFAVPGDAEHRIERPANQLRSSRLLRRARGLFQSYQPTRFAGTVECLRLLRAIRHRRPVTAPTTAVRSHQSIVIATA